MSESISHKIIFWDLTITQPSPASFHLNPISSLRFDALRDVEPSNQLKRARAHSFHAGTMLWKGQLLRMIDDTATRFYVGPLEKISLPLNGASPRSQTSAFILVVCLTFGQSRVSFCIAHCKLPTGAPRYEQPPKANFQDPFLRGSHWVPYRRGSASSHGLRKES